MEQELTNLEIAEELDISEVYGYLCEEKRQSDCN